MNAHKTRTAHSVGAARWVLATMTVAVLTACGGGGASDSLDTQAADTSSEFDKQVASSLALGTLAITGTAPITGSIYTSDEGCTAINKNLYDTKDTVYLNGGPRGGSSGLPDGLYYVRVTSPSGQDVLGLTPAVVGNDKRVTISGGKFASCYKLTDILEYNGGTPGYADTPNNGGVYKVWVSQDPSFTESASKTDNFRVKDAGGQEPPVGTLVVQKFYDANANGTQDPEEALIEGWKVRVAPNGGAASLYDTTYTEDVMPGLYKVDELMANELVWLPTRATSITAQVDNGQTKTVQFGNVCLGAGGGKTLGYWSNSNGALDFTAANGMNVVNNLNLANDKALLGTPHFANYTAFRTWLLKATATNMAYMLSAQMSATQLNVASNKVIKTQLLYAPGAMGANGFGFASVETVLAEANTSVGSNPNTVLAGSARTYQEALKNALDRANNNINFVQTSATNCPVPTFTVAPATP